MTAAFLDVKFGIVGTPPPVIDGIAAIVANAKSLWQQQHPYALFAKSAADKTGTTAQFYGDGGQWAALAYVMLGDATYAAKCYAKIQPVLSKDPTDPNDVREYFAERALMFGMIRPALTADQDAALVKGLHRWAEWCCAINTAQYVGGWRYSDSDQTIGQYFGCVLVDKLTGSAFTQRADVQKARDAIVGYCAKAKGGEWIESAEYNLGTIKILLLGAVAAGLSNYPEVQAIIPDLAAELSFHLTPDLKTAWQWGDVQEPRSLHTIHRYPCSAMLIGLNNDKNLNDALNTFAPNIQPYGVFTLGYRSLYTFQPPTAPPNPVPLFRVTPAVGVGIYKRDTALCGVKLSPFVGVDHSTTHHGDVQLYLDGEWALTRPLGYTASWNNANTPLFCNLPNMSIRPDAKWEELPTGFRVTSSTSGPYYGSGYYDPPPAFMTSFQRVLEYVWPNKITCTDSFSGSDPRKLPKLTRYSANDLNAINAAQSLWMQVWHAPVAPTETPTGYTWQLKSGKTVTLNCTGWKSRFVLKETDVLSAYFVPSELAGYQIRFGCDDPTCVMSATVEIA